MDIFVLIGFGFALLIFILLFRRRHNNGYKQMMAENKGVQPLFKERSAAIKYQALRNSLKNDLKALKILERVHTDFVNGKMSVDVYHDSLDELSAGYLNQ